MIRCGELLGFFLDSAPYSFLTLRLTMFWQVHNVIYRNVYAVNHVFYARMGFNVFIVDSQPSGGFLEVTPEFLR